MASEVEICNRALQMVGASRISVLTDNNPRAQECNRAYEPIRDAELRAHPWAFAIRRKSLAADSDSPSFGRENAFQLPSDFLRLQPLYPEDNDWDQDWLIEGRKIYTDDESPLKIRYVARIEDPNTFDPLFREALAAKIAEAICEPLTQSNTKMARVQNDYTRYIREARRTNAIERPAQEPPTDPWITARA